MLKINNLLDISILYAVIYVNVHRLFNSRNLYYNIHKTNRTPLSFFAGIINLFLLILILLRNLFGHSLHADIHIRGKEGEKNADETQLSDTANFLCLYRIMLSDTCVLSIAHQDMCMCPCVPPKKVQISQILSKV